MISSTNLANRLNNFRDGKEIPVPETEEFKDTMVDDKKETENNEAIESLKDSIMRISGLTGLLFSFLLKSFVFGFSITTIFNTGWEWPTFVLIGIATEILLSKIFSIFPNNS